MNFVGYDEDDLDGLNELESIDPVPPDSSHMHNGSSDGQVGLGCLSGGV